MNPWGRAGVSLRSLLTEFRISLVRLTMQLLHVNARMGASHVGSSRGTRIYHLSNLFRFNSQASWTRSAGKET